MATYVLIREEAFLFIDLLRIYKNQIATKCSYNTIQLLHLSLFSCFNDCVVFRFFSFYFHFRIHLFQYLFILAYISLLSPPNDIISFGCHRILIVVIVVIAVVSRRCNCCS